ncbi:uncharacterized protein RHOBADRAFT_41552 [Rhodotorula graminis WP1]|uniref:Uncharacterized protein n=1 Tax=Rhodotorula graminis (strain WP1) TaxID=578459 RepID=A0A194SA13_RHOGW|nr:uncharacterized protein RHOBADRAFT_41552 [Rhodotorula graminis WP1]KPV77558.1 hypothetical protein RHOBADRAFT_41552 [Rhodotorula graminis WP1]
MAPTYEQPRADLDVTLPPRPFLAPHTALAPRAYTPTAPFAPAFNSALTATASFAFSYVNHSVANLVESRDSGLAGASGGCAAGFITGLRSGSVPAAMGMCAFTGALVGTYDLAGGQLGWEKGRKMRSEREEDRVRFFKKRDDVEATEEA